MEVQLNFSEQPNPIILTSPSGYPNYKEIQLLGKSVGNFAEPSTRKMIKLSNDQINWVGVNEQLNDNVYLGVQQGTIVQLHPILMQTTLQQQIIKQHKQYQSRNSALEDGLTYFEQRKMVAEEMGTNKSRRKMRQMETNKVDEENIVEAEAIKDRFIKKQDEIREQIEIDKELQENEIKALKEELLPTFNKGNMPVHKIYDISSIISTEDLELLNVTKLQVYLHSKTAESLKFYHPQIINILQNLSLQHFDNSKLKLLKYIEFLNLLFKFQFKSTFTNTTLSKISRELHIENEQLVNSIIQKFYQVTPGKEENTFNFNRSNFLKDKYFCFIIVLHLFIHNFSFDIVPLAKELKLNIKKLKSYCSECGCILTKNNEKFIATLKPFR